MKHIKIRAEINQNKSQFGYPNFTLEIVEQSHGSMSFGHPDSLESRVFLFGDTALISSNFPEFVTFYERDEYRPWKLPVSVKRVLYVKSPPKEPRNKITGINVAEWKALREAIAAYNEWGASQELTNLEKTKERYVDIMLDKLRRDVV